MHIYIYTHAYTYIYIYIYIYTGIDLLCLTVDVHYTILCNHGGALDGGGLSHRDGLQGAAGHMAPGRPPNAGAGLGSIDSTLGTLAFSFQEGLYGYCEQGGLVTSRIRIRLQYLYDRRVQGGLRSKCSRGQARDVRIRATESCAFLFKRGFMNIAKWDLQIKSIDLTFMKAYDHVHSVLPLRRSCLGQALQYS